jgi:hypothetical protein
MVYYTTAAQEVHEAYHLPEWNLHTQSLLPKSQQLHLVCAQDEHCMALSARPRSTNTRSTWSTCTSERTRD